MPSDWTPSKHQRALYDWIDNGMGHAVVKAVAGSGKTSSIVRALERIPSRCSVLFVAFNKDIADELARRVPAHCQARTLNSFGVKAWFSWARSYPEVNKHKTSNLLRSILSYAEGDAYGAEIETLVALAKSHGVVPAGASHFQGLMPDCPETWKYFIERYGIAIKAQDRDRAMIRVSQVLKEGIKTSRSVIDYDDQLYMPVIAGADFPQFDFVFGDEVQDWSPVQRTMIKRALKPTGRFIGVGDENQAIYGFRGAASDSIDKIIEEFRATVLPLSVTYRCPRSVVALAQKLVPEIEAAANAVEGVVESPSSYRVSDFTPADLVVCRCTAPLVSLAYRIIGQGVPCRVLGKDIGQGLITLIDKLDVRTIDGPDGLYIRLGKWEDKESLSFALADRPGLAQSVHDKADSLRAIMDSRHDLETAANLKDAIRTTFAPENSKANVLTLATIHKAKGLDADNVWLLNPDLLPGRWATQDWELQQERNLEYVAYTRAKQALRLISDTGLCGQDGRPLTVKKRPSKEPKPLTPSQKARIENEIFGALKVGARR